MGVVLYHNWDTVAAELFYWYKLSRQLHLSKIAKLNSRENCSDCGIKGLRSNRFVRFDQFHINGKMVRATTP